MTPAEPSIPQAAAAPDRHPVEEQLEALQAQVAALTAEIFALRQRDSTVNSHMHQIDEELRLAARLQQDFLPKSMPQVGRVRFHALFRPAGYVSGDLYDVMRLDERHVGFYMADAVGHGMPAALLTMFIKNALVTKEVANQSYRLLPPAETMARLNEALVGQNLATASFATAIYGTVNAETLEVQFAKGGHPHPAVLRADGRLEDVPSEGSLLGIFPDEIFQTAQIQLKPGERFFIVSDGMEVAFPNDGQADAEQWRREIIKRRHLPGDELIRGLCQVLDNSTGSLAPKDDLTIIIAEVCEDQ